MISGHRCPSEIRRRGLVLVLDADGAAGLDELLRGRGPRDLDPRQRSPVSLDQLRRPVRGQRKVAWRAERERIRERRRRRVVHVDLVGHVPVVNRRRGFAERHLDRQLRRLAVRDEVPLEHLEDLRRPSELRQRDHHRVAGADLHRVETEARRERDLLPGALQFDACDALRRAARGRHRQDDIAPVSDRIVLRVVSRRGLRRKVGRLPLALLGDEHALHGIYPVAGTRLGLHADRPGEIGVGERDGRDPIAGRVWNHLAAGVCDQAAHRGQDFADVIVGRCARVEHAVRLVAVFVGRRRRRENLHLLVADVCRRGERGVVDFARRQAEAVGGVSQVVAQTESGVCRVDSRRCARVVHLLALHHRGDVRDAAGPDLVAPLELHVNVSDPAQAMRARPLAVRESRGRGDEICLRRLRVSAELLVDLGVAGEATACRGARAGERELVVEVNVADLLDLVPGERDHKVEKLVLRSGRGDVNDHAGDLGFAVHDLPRRNRRAHHLRAVR